MAELAACVLSLCPVASGAAGPYEDGASAYKRGDYATTLRLWRPLAEQGDAYAQFSLGAMYDEGQGVPQNYAVAVEWFRKAADQGLAQRVPGRCGGGGVVSQSRPTGTRQRSI